MFPAFNVGIKIPYLFKCLRYSRITKNSSSVQLVTLSLSMLPDSLQVMDQPRPFHFYNVSTNDNWTDRNSKNNCKHANHILRYLNIEI